MKQHLESLSCASEKECCEECHENVYEGYNLQEIIYEYPNYGFRIFVSYCCTNKLSSSEAFEIWKNKHQEKLKKYEKRMKMIKKADKLLE